MVIKFLPGRVGMHEWALAESVVLAVIKESEREKLKRVLKVNIKVGELQSIELDIFETALESNLEIYGLSVETNIEEGRCNMKCKRCLSEWSFSEAVGGMVEDEIEALHFIPEISHIYIRCPECGSPDFEILGGRGVWIESIEGEVE